MHRNDWRHLSTFLAYLLTIGCGSAPSEQPIQRVSPPPVITAFVPGALTLAPGQTGTVQVTGDPSSISWAVDCEDGRISISPGDAGTSLTVLALDAGTCLITASPLPPFEDQTWIRIPPLPRSNGCASNAQCGSDAPLCKSFAPASCSPVCTSACKQDSDCPAGNSCSAGTGLCRPRVLPYLECD